MATIAIPCEPRVLINGANIAQNLLDSVAASSRDDHDVWLLLPYRAKAAAEPMIKILKNQFRSLRTIELLTPVADNYALVTHLFARLQQALAYENAPDERAIIWVSERGNETFKPDAIDTLDATFYRKKAPVIAGKYFTIPATETSYESHTVDGTFVMSSQLAKLYPQRVPYVTVSQHFRLFLDKVLTEKCFNVENWDDLITVGEIPDADYFKLPQVLGEVAVTTPAEVSIASFQAKPVDMLGCSEQVGGATKAREDLKDAEDLKPSVKVVTLPYVSSENEETMKTDAVKDEDKIVVKDLTPSAEVVTPSPVKSKTKKAMKADAVKDEDELDK